MVAQTSTQSDTLIIPVTAPGLDMPPLRLTLMSRHWDRLLSETVTARTPRTVRRVNVEVRLVAAEDGAITVVPWVHLYHGDGQPVRPHTGGRPSQTEQQIRDAIDAAVAALSPVEVVRSIVVQIQARAGGAVALTDQAATVVRALLTDPLAALAADHDLRECTSRLRAALYAVEAAMPGDVDVVQAPRLLAVTAGK